MDEMDKGKIETIKKKWCSIVSTSTSLASATQGKKKEGGGKGYSLVIYTIFQISWILP